MKGRTAVLLIAMVALPTTRTNPMTPRVRARDRAGNVGPWSREHRVRLP